jgi:hypothetical protein
VAVAAAALGFAHPAHADSPDVPDPSTAATVSAPDPSALADAAAAVAQGGATNVTVSVRIGSPGDDGNVSQTITVSTGAQAPASASDGQQNTASQSQSTQTAPSNIAISVRVNSPGSNGAVTQTTSAGAGTAPATTTQYQAPAQQYPADSASAPPAPTPDPSPSTPQPDASPAPDPAPAQTVTSAPSSWVWNLTVSGCGDTSGGDTTKTIDTGVQGWIWNWNVGTMCQPQPAVSPINLPESNGGISLPALSAPDPPTPPSVTAPELPALPYVPQPVIAAAPPVPAAVVVPVLGSIELPVELAPVGAGDDPIALPQALGLLSPVPSHHERRRMPATIAPRRGVLAATVAFDPPVHVVTTQTVHDPRPAPSRTATHKAPPPWETLSLILDSSFAPAPAGASAGGGGGAAGGAAALLSLWLLLQLPGFAYLRLPARQRRPRGRVDDKQTRPG